MSGFQDIVGHKPVSYTHLDVYKRQVLDVRKGEITVPAEGKATVEIYQIQ